MSAEGSSLGRLPDRMLAPRTLAPPSLSPPVTPGDPPPLVEMRVKEIVRTMGVLGADDAPDTPLVAAVAVEEENIFDDDDGCTSKGGHKRQDSVHKEVVELIAKAKSAATAATKEGTTPRPLPPIPPPSASLSSLLTHDEKVESKRQLEPPRSLAEGSDRFEMPDPKADPEYTELGLHAMHERLFADFSNTVSISRSSAQARVRLRKSGKYTNKISKNAYVDVSTKTLKRTSSVMDSESAKLTHLDSNFETLDEIGKHMDTEDSAHEGENHTHFAGWVEKLGQKQGILGSNRYKKRYMTLLNGTLTWYSGEDMGKQKGRLHVEAYKFETLDEADENVKDMLESDEMANVIHFDKKSKYFHFTLRRSEVGGNIMGNTTTGESNISAEVNEALFEGQSREKLVMRTNSTNVASRMVTALVNSMEKYRNRSANYCIRFAGLQLMHPPSDKGSEAVRISRKQNTLALEPVRQLVVTLSIPGKLFDALSPKLRSGSLVRVRPVLYTQGISSNLITATQRLTRSTAMLSHRNSINEEALVRFEQYVDDLVNCPLGTIAKGDDLFKVKALLEELRSQLKRSANKPQPIDGCPALLIASDLAAALGGVKFVNCMSGKDRTGMSATLEQARVLVRENDFVARDAMSYPPSRANEYRSAEQIALLRKDFPNSVKLSDVVTIADIMRTAGPRVHICRKSIHKPKFKGSINLFCYKPPKHIAGDVEG